MKRIIEVPERWAPVLNYEDLYEVSDQGRVRRIARGRSTHPGKEIKPSDVRGYLRLNLHKERKQKQFSVHTLVWEAFNGPVPEGMQLNHKNGITSDNRLENLEVVTPRENVLHAKYILGRKFGPGKQLGMKNAQKLRELHDKYGCPNRGLATLFGVSEETVSRALNFKTYAHA